MTVITSNTVMAFVYTAINNNAMIVPARGADPAGSSHRDV
jgi:hypothetical protein